MNKITLFFKTKFPVFTYWCGKKYLLSSTFCYRKNPQKWTIKRYKKRFGIKLNLDSPTTFYEKINFLKHNCFDDSQTLLSDKYRVKDHLKNNGDGKIVPKALFHTKNIKELKKWFYENKDKYQKFVIKTNHSCGDIFIYNNGTITRKYGVVLKKISQVFRMLKIGMKYNHYYTCFERNYKDIDPLIFVEEYIEMNDATEYELMTNYGEVKFINVVKKRQSANKTEILYDTNWKSINEGKTSQMEKPKHYDFMAAFAKKYASSYPFCRIDFIENESALYFLEFTFVKSGGIGYFKPDSLNEYLGGLIDISKLV